MRKSHAALLTDADFLVQFGFFYTIWTNIELFVDIAIGIFLKTSDQETHLITAHMDFGRKATLLRDLVRNSTHKNRNALFDSLSVIQNESNRNVFAHSYLGESDEEEKIVFMERKPYGKFTAIEHIYTLSEFAEHVNKIRQSHLALIAALELPDGRHDEFARAALSLNNKS